MVPVMVPFSGTPAWRAVTDWLEAHPDRFDRIVFTVFGEDDELAYRQALDEGARSPCDPRPDPGLEVAPHALRDRI